MMKKRILILSLLITLMGCNNASASYFDDDYEILVNNINNADFLETTLSPIDEDRTYLIEHLNLNIEAYYQELKEKFTYVFVLVVKGNEERIKDIRSFVALENVNSNMSIAQIGFDGNKKTIEVKKGSSSYKGLQFFVTPYIVNSTKVHFYFECDHFVGHYYTFASLKEYKI